MQSPATLFRRILDRLRPNRKHSHKSRRPSSPTKQMDTLDLSLSNLVESPTAPTRISSSYGAHHVLQERLATPGSAYTPSGYTPSSTSSTEAKRLDASSSVVYLEESFKASLPPLPNSHLTSTSSFGEGLLSQINNRFLTEFAEAAKQSVPK